MHDREMTFVIPTYRLKEVGQTIEEYDEHFWRNGHSVRMIVFDDSSPAKREKCDSLLEQKAFYGFEPDFLHQSLMRIVDDVVSVIKGSMELWPVLAEISYFQKGLKGLPQFRVNNKEK